MGDVFLAHDPSLERDVAIKLLHKESLRGLRDEAKVLAALRHPAIVTIYEIGEHDGQDFIAMEYLPGRTLRDAMNAGAPRAELLAIVARVASALAAAHAAGILHRDIKPENVVELDSGEVKVVDFGVSRRLDATKRRAATASEVATLLLADINLTPDTVVEAGTVTVFGTPAYMAPEVLFGQPSTPQADVYSLGVVLHEILVKKRPHDATTLVEMIAQIIADEPVRVADPIGDLVEAMLARDPAKRPSLATVIARLQPRRAARRWPLVAGAAIALAGAATAAWALTRPPKPPPVTARATELAATLAVAPITVHMPSYGPEAPIAGAIGDSLARLFGDVTGAKLQGLPAQSADPAAAAAMSASYLVTGTVDEQAGTLHGAFALTVLPSGTQLASVTVDAPSPRLAHLLDEAAVALAQKLAPGAALDGKPDRVRAERFYREGQRLLRLGTFTHARAYLEQAVDADPTFADGWYAVALALAWTDAAEDLEHAATQKAYELATGTRKELIHGMAEFLAGDFARAEADLRALEPRVEAGDRRELYYYLGEAAYHDGDFASARDDFAKALEIDHDFRPATVHAWEMAVARRDVEAATQYLAAGGAEHEWIEFAAGRYEELAERGNPQWQRWSQLVLGRPVTQPLTEGEQLAQAAATGDHVKVAALFTSAMRDPERHAVEGIGEVVIAAGDKDETKQLVAYLRAHPKLRGRARLLLLAAPILDDKSLLDTPHESTRDRLIADASAAELAGDRARAAKVLAVLVANPSFSWDYPERAALLRNRNDHKQLCADTLRPAVFHPAFLVLRAQCSRSAVVGKP